MMTQIMKDVHMQEYHLTHSCLDRGHYCTNLLYEFLDPYGLAEVWVNDPDECGYMVELKSTSMGPHFLKLTKEDIVFLLMAAQKEGWFEDV